MTYSGYKKLLMYGLLLFTVLFYFHLIYAQETTDTAAPIISNVTTSSPLSDGINIDWVTDEPATFTFEYGTSQSYGSSATTSATPGTSGTVVLSGLTPDTKYYYCIHATDAANNAASSCDNFTTAPVPDTTPSIISGVQNESLLATSTKIVWVTDELAYSRVRYGTTESLGTDTPVEETAKLLHDVTITGLISNTKYYFCIDATDTHGNKSDSCANTFTTAQEPPVTDVAPPVISLLTAKSITRTSAIISWTTNESAKIQVEYGTNLNYGSASRLGTSFGHTHSAFLSGLSPSTLYHYRVKSTDRAGNEAVSVDETFTTLPIPQTVEPGTVVSAPDTSFVDGASESGAVRAERVRGYRGNQSSDLSQKISALGSTPVFSIPIPILFGATLRNIFPNFGDPRSGGRKHEGEDMLVAKGTPIVSPTAAVVLRTETGASEGNAVYTANPGGETFVYMHLDHFGEGVTPGTVLQRGSLIGYVGDTGNAAGGPAHLHFETHNSSGTPVDPFPRLSQEFTLAEKISFLNQILTQTANPTNLAQFLVINFRSTFTSAGLSGIPLPALISSALISVPDVPIATNSRGLPPGDLASGSTGVEVRNLQSFLIAKATGPAAASLTSAGATGTFGSLTKAALIEYQRSVGLTADGYYGPKTRASVLGAGGTVTIPASPSTPVSVPSGTGILSITRVLRLGSVGNDVKILQSALQLSVDGSFGLKTKTAVIAFQKSKGLVADGQFGSASRAALAGITGGGLPAGCTTLTPYSPTTGVKCR